MYLFDFVILSFIFFSVWFQMCKEELMVWTGVSNASKLELGRMLSYSY